MEALIAVYGVGCLIVGGLLIFTYTKKGKEWLKNL